MDRNFGQLLRQKWRENKFICIGLDPDCSKLPESLRLPHSERLPKVRGTQYSAFCKNIVDTTLDVAGAYKTNLSSFVADAEHGLEALRDIIEYIHLFAPDVPVILDAKYGGAIPEENLGYARQAFECFKADAVTVLPYSGQRALQPFLDRKDKGIFVVCRTSGEGSEEFQVADVSSESIPACYMALYEHIAYRTANFWNENGNCGLVVGANRLNELRTVRQMVFALPILCPAIGSQQLDVSLDEQVRGVVSNGSDGEDLPLLLSSSRSILYASSGPDFAEAARNETLKLNDLVNKYR